MDKGGRGVPRPHMGLLLIRDVQAVVSTVQHKHKQYILCDYDNISSDCDNISRPK